MGLNAAETHERIDGILAFADIGDHIDQPIKHYSSGMVVRLGFAVATSVVPDVLITDEVLAVGDESFQKKCIAWMERFLSSGGTLLLCSHSMYHIQKLCQKAIWIDQGLLRLYGEAQDVSRQYLAWHEEKARLAGDQGSHEKSFDEGSDKSGIYHIKKLSIIGEVAGEVSECTSSHELLAINMGQALRVKGRIHSPDGRTPQVTLGIVRSDGTPVYGVVNEMDGYELSRANDGTFLFELVFTDLPLLPGRYIARAHAMDPEGMRLFDHVERSFEIKGDARELGFCYLQHRWVSSIQVEGGSKNEST
jgi:lipopolysaccharide transport system ATP-binding protein